ncbi:MAG TPA: hypothetical protein VFC99_17790 [Acidimicrobiia bacterium]|nr:hypothetical protein [Acidimicrobiia bacterium]
MHGYWRSRKHLTGLALAAVSPVLGLSGVVAPVAAVALVPALYAVGALYSPAARPPELAPGVDADAVRRSLDAVRVRVRGRVPVAIGARVRSIVVTVTDVLPQVQSLPPGSRARYTIAKTATDYLPSAVDAYLALPRRYAEQEAVAGGRTPAALLCDQLDLLAAEVARIADAIRRADADRLVTNGRFLADRFGSPLRRAPGSS